MRRLTRPHTRRSHVQKEKGLKTSRLAELKSRVSATLAERNRDMVATAESTATGTRKRALPLAAAGFATLGLLFSAVSANILAVNFTTANTSFKLHSNYLQGESAAGFLSRNTPQDGNGDGVVELGIRTARLAGLCAIAQQDLPVVGSVSLMILAGVPVGGSFTPGSNTTVDGAGNPISYDSNGLLTGASEANAIAATNLFVNSPSLGGYGNQISGLNLGQSANTVAGSAGITWPTGQTPPVAGQFGLFAENLNVGGLDGETYGVNLQGQINLPNLKLKVIPGARTQTDCPTEAMS